MLSMLDCRCSHELPEHLCKCCLILLITVVVILILVLAGHVGMNDKAVVGSMLALECFLGFRRRVSVWMPATN